MFEWDTVNGYLLSGTLSVVMFEWDTVSGYVWVGHCQWLCLSGTLSVVMFEWDTVSSYVWVGHCQRLCLSRTRSVVMFEWYKVSGYVWVGHCQWLCLSGTLSVVMFEWDTVSGDVWVGQCQWKKEVLPAHSHFLCSCATKHCSLHIIYQAAFKGLSMSFSVLSIVKKNFINIWFAIRRFNKYILYAEGLSKGTQATQSVKRNEMYKWKDEIKYLGHEPELICAQG